MQEFIKSHQNDLTFLTATETTQQTQANKDEEDIEAQLKKLTLGE